MFIAACEGFLDKEENEILIQRKIAQTIWGAGGGKPLDFNKFWPLKGTNAVDDIKTWGTEDDAKELRERIEKAHGIKLS